MDNFDQVEVDGWIIAYNVKDDEVISKTYGLIVKKEINPKGITPLVSELIWVSWLFHDSVPSHPTLYYFKLLTDSHFARYEYQPHDYHIREIVTG